MLWERLICVLAIVVALTRKLQRIQRTALSTDAIDGFVRHVAQTSDFLSVPVTTNASGEPVSTATEATTHMRALCQPYIEKTVRSTLSFHREGLERAATIVQQRLGGLRSVLSL